MICRADAVRLPLADRAVDLVMGSPPYLDARTYGIAAQRGLTDWVAWMLAVSAEALRVSRGLVVWVIAGVTRDRTYQPGPEGLLWEWVRRGGSAYRPCYWHRYGIPGSGGDQWYRADVEYVLALKRSGKLPYADPTANGHAPRYSTNGAMSHRLGDGTRVNQWGKTGTESVNGHAHRTADGPRQRAARPSHRMSSKRLERGSEKASAAVLPALANPGNLVHTDVGGGKLGSPLAHENEAPYPEALPTWFVASHCPPGGTVLDPFAGSGTTLAAALALGRRGVGCDLRQSQCQLTRRRLATVTPGFAFTGGAHAG